MRPSTPLPPLLLALALVGIVVPADAQGSASWVPEPAPGQEFELSIRSIMRGEENVGVAPSQVRWTDDGQWVCFTWRPGGLAWDEESGSHLPPRRHGGPTARA